MRFQCSYFTFIFLEKLRDEDDPNPESDTDDCRAYKDDNDNLDAVVEGPAVQAHVELARTIRKFTYLN
jgi:hypothetical protein